MNANEHFETWSPYGSDHPDETLFDGKTMIRFAEQYHQAKSKEESEELLHARMAVHGLAEVLRNVAPEVFEKDNEWNATVEQQLYLTNKAAFGKEGEG